MTFALFCVRRLRAGAQWGYLDILVARRCKGFLGGFENGDLGLFWFTGGIILGGRVFW